MATLSVRSYVLRYSWIPTCAGMTGRCPRACLGRKARPSERTRYDSPPKTCRTVSTGRSKGKAGAGGGPDLPMTPRRSLLAEVGVQVAQRVHAFPVVPNFERGERGRLLEHERVPPERNLQVLALGRVAGAGELAGAAALVQPPCVDGSPKMVSPEDEQALEGLGPPCAARAGTAATKSARVATSATLTNKDLHPRGAARPDATERALAGDHRPRRRTDPLKVNLYKGTCRKSFFRWAHRPGILETIGYGSHRYRRFEMEPARFAAPTFSRGDGTHDLERLYARINSGRGA
jgi:hypothetical protein